MPTTDRLFLGFAVSAGIIGCVLHLEYLRLMALSGELSLDALVFGFVGWAFFSVLATFFLHVPIWAVLHFVRAPDWVGSSVGGAVAAAACGLVFWVLSNHPMSEIPVTPGRNACVIIGAIVGAIAGSVGWRVAKADIGL